MANDVPPRPRYDDFANAWRPAADAPLIPLTLDPRRPAWRRHGVIAAAAAGLLALLVASWMLGSAVTNPAGTASSGDWRIELESAGSKPLTALVYGEESGLHVIRVPAAGAGLDERRVMSAKLGKGEVHMISFGSSPLHIQATSPAGGTPMTPVSMSARGRIVTLFENGVRTGW